MKSEKLSRTGDPDNQEVLKGDSGGLSGLVAGDSAICGRLAALILRLRPAGSRFEEFRSLKGRVGLAILKSQRVEAGCDLNLRP